MKTFAEYIWLDGSVPVQKLRSKTRVVELPQNWNLNVNDLPIWNFDGSSTNQATGDDSECLLNPACAVKNPLSTNSYLVLCEVNNPDNTPHVSNKRAKLAERLQNGGFELETLWGFEQEYCFMNNENDALLGWPAGNKNYPKPQGDFYCGVGCDEVIGRQIVEKHAKACVDAGLLYYGNNAEVMLGQWEYQIGYRGFDRDPEANPLVTSDHLWLARYLLYKIGEEYNVYATLNPKPKDGDWNGSGMHTNFSDVFTRNKETGAKRIEAIRSAMEERHLEHQKNYGHGNRKRLTGLHETAPYEKFTMDQANRGASIRIPNKTQQDGFGYLEDRRPAANADPYVVTDTIISTLLSIDGWKKE